MNDHDRIPIPDRVMDEIVFEHSHGILIELLKRKPELIEEINEIAFEYLKDIDEDDIKNELFCILDGIRIEDIWDRSGSTRDGYVDPIDLAWEMFEEEVESFLEKARKYQGLGMVTERDIYFRGILRGLYRFGMESNSEYRDYIPDAPEETFEGIVDKWKKLSGDPERIEGYVLREFNWRQN